MNAEALAPVSSGSDRFLLVKTFEIANDPRRAGSTVEVVLLLPLSLEGLGKAPGLFSPLVGIASESLFEGAGQSEVSPDDDSFDAVVVREMKEAWLKFPSMAWSVEAMVFSCGLGKVNDSCSLGV